MSAPPVRQRPHRRGEAGHRRAHHTGADLADARLFVGDARVDGGRDAGFGDKAHVDAGGDAGEVERGDGPLGVLRRRDLAHGAGEDGCVRRRAGADETDNRRRRRHGEAAEPDGLHDGRVAHVRVGVGGGETGEIEPHRHFHRRGEPGIARAADADAEVRAVTAHGGDDGRLGDVARRIGHGLAERHGDVEEELVVAGDEGQRVGEARAVVGRARQPGRDLAQEQPGAADVPLVHLVAHAEAPGDQRLQGHAVARAQRLAEHGTQHIAQPGQALQHFGIVAAEAHHLAQALVDGAVGAVAEFAVLHHHHRHRPRGKPGHRPDGIEVVVGKQAHAAAGRQRLRGRKIWRPPLEHDGAADGALHRPAHAWPLDRRTGVQDGLAFAQGGDRRDGRHHVDQHRLAGEDPLHRLAVGGFDGRIAGEAREQGCQLCITAGRRRPIDVRDRHAGTRQLAGEPRQADVYDAER